jgi:RsiW-degrading membrane proteinase PrsW (M82 family)
MAGLVVYVLAVSLLSPVIAGAGSASVSIGIVLALVPVLLWLLLFYVQDASEPEPVGYVLRVAAAGAVLAAVIAVPMLRRLASTAWLATGPLPNLLASILLVGGTQEFCKYLAVRFTVFETLEFDEVADGVTYGTAAGLGVATMLNLAFVLASPSIAPLPTSIRIVVASLSHAAFGGVLGYFLGRAKIFGEYARVVLGFVMACVLNGVVAYSVREIAQTGLSVNPWYGLVLAAAVAVVVTLVLLRAARGAQQGVPA